MSFTFTPHWAFPTLFVLFVGACASMFASGCAADTVGLDVQETHAEVCGGAVCFQPTDVAVKHWGAGDLTVVAWRADDQGCVVPHGVTPGDASGTTIKGSTPVVSHKGGTAIELRLHQAKPGARLPLVTHQTADWAEGAFATARAFRIGDGDGRALADEETVSGEATILDLDERTGRVRVRLSGRWSSGVTGELLVDVDGPHQCAAAE